jgi:hypothetical protein
MCEVEGKNTFIYSPEFFSIDFDNFDGQMVSFDARGKNSDFLIEIFPMMKSKLFALFVMFCYVDGCSQQSVISSNEGENPGSLSHFHNLSVRHLQFVS